MSGMDMLDDAALDDIVHGNSICTMAHVQRMARELLAHRRASQAAPAPVAWRGKHFHPEASAWIYKDGPEKPATAFGSIGQLEPLYAAPAPSDGLREALERIGWHDLTAIEARDVARAALSASPAQEGGNLDVSTCAVLDRAERIVAKQSQQERRTSEVFLRPTEGEA